MDLKEHWEAVYRSRRPTEVSWYQAEAALSTRLIRQFVTAHDAPIIDVGGGASVLVAELAAAGYTDLTVLDLSLAAITAAQARLGAAGGKIRWMEADILNAALPAGGFSFWHDRAVFHFLTDPSDRARYVTQVRLAVRPGGHVLVATFAEDGPTRCSGLEVVRYSPAALHSQFGPGFTFLRAEREEHHTPSGGTQAFTYCLCRNEGQPASSQA
jgi:SAM-dependent methyltransferase